jgi:drug/metabolite transporter (DMT)-like permease
MKGLFYLLTLSGVAASSFAHVLLKLSARQGGSATAMWLDPRSLGAYALFAAAVLATAFSIRELEYGVIVALSALGYPLVALLSAGVLREKIAPHQAGAQALVCAGVLIYCLPL